MEKVLLWLDDIRNPLENDWLVFSPIEQPYKVVWAKTYAEFIEYIIKNGLPSAICFDHDLGDNFDLREVRVFTEWFDIDNNKEYTGYDCAWFLVNYCIDNNCELPLYNIQSANPVGKENIDMLLKNFKKQQHGI